MALTMGYISDALRKFDTEVIVKSEDWPILMGMFKFSPELPACTLDRMHLKSVVGGFDGLQQRMGELLAERDRQKAEIDQLKAEVSELKSKNTSAEHKTKAPIK